WASTVSRKGKRSRWGSRNVGSPEKRNAARSLSSTATVLLIRGIAQINKSGFAYLRRRGDWSPVRGGTLAPWRFVGTQSGCLQRLAARDGFPPRTWSLPLNTG